MSTLTERLIRKQDFVACESAFVDVRIPGSEGKLNYSFIGPGVTQSDEQFVNIREPHGFQIGGVQLPHSHVNNLHLHFTAEVFMCARGEWLCFWGADGKEGELTLTPGDIVSVPTWVFRGFKNVGPDDGFMFTTLGGDDTGGIIWGPDVLRQAAETGLYLTRDNRLLDTQAGQTLPPAEQLLAPIGAEDIAQLTHYTAEQLAAQCVVKHDQRRWSARPFLTSVLPGYGVELAPVIGYGLSQDRNAQATITNPHGFSLDWLRGAPGERLAAHRLAVKQVLITMQGQWRLRVGLEDDASATPITLDEWSIYSVPAGAWRSLEALGTGTNELMAIGAGDARKQPEWQPALVAQALAEGWTLDAGGYLAPARLLPWFS